MAAYNSRATQAERLRQRIYHKFSYNPDKYDGQIGCTGCGRCIDVCPAGIDITYILRRVANA
jgi:ferredoxin